MAPNISSLSPVRRVGPDTTVSKPPPVPTRIVWRNVALFVLLHFGALCGAWLFFTDLSWSTRAFTVLLYVLSGLGITAGAHRLWCHRAYKARLPLRMLLAFFNTIALENDLYEWSRDHRVHHKYTETDADPHDVRRGFFFSHMGWLLCRKHPEVIRRGKTIDMSDLEADPIVTFQRRHYVKLALTCCFVLPTLVPWLGWGETPMRAFLTAALLRYTFTLHCTWLVNSAAHMWGSKPFDRTIEARQNAGVSLGALGEGYHNYHHVFPYDYAASELGWRLNPTTAFIDGMAWLGQAYDRRTVNPEMVTKRVERTGDGSQRAPSLI